MIVAGRVSVTLYMHDEPTPRGEQYRTALRVSTRDTRSVYSHRCGEPFGEQYSIAASVYFRGTHSM